MHSTSGNSILVGTLAACSSARICRLWRRSSEKTRSESPMLVPKRSAWVSMVAKVPISSTPVRSARLRSDFSRRAPARISRLVQCSSSASAALLCLISSATLVRPASSPRPASTQTSIRSAASGKFSKISRCRSRARQRQHQVGQVAADQRRNQHIEQQRQSSLRARPPAAERRPAPAKSERQQRLAGRSRSEARPAWRMPALQEAQPQRRGFPVARRARTAGRRGRRACTTVSVHADLARACASRAAARCSARVGVNQISRARPAPA